MTFDRVPPKHRALCVAATLIAFAGCAHQAPQATEWHGGLRPEVAQAAAAEFQAADRKDPWNLKRSPAPSAVPAYLADGLQGSLIDSGGRVIQFVHAGTYKNGTISTEQVPSSTSAPADAGRNQVLDLYHGRLTTYLSHGTVVEASGRRNWPLNWETADILIDGDPESQVISHAFQFYLLQSIDPSSSNSIPPMGLSSNVYNGHIFWDAETWMLPALLAQHPDEAKAMIRYRFERLAAAISLAKRHGYAGAEFPWESAATGDEEAPGEFARERHVTADIGLAAWQTYLWTGDSAFLKRIAWPIIDRCAEYWASRVHKGPDGRWHVLHVLSPDETAGIVDDDAYTNAVVQKFLHAAAAAARATGSTGAPRWTQIADGMFLPRDHASGLPVEHVGVSETLRAKQADTALLVFPLKLPFPAGAAHYIVQDSKAHTIAAGPAMTSSVWAAAEALDGSTASAYTDFQASYRPFMRGAFCAFSEKRSTNNCTFVTGMAGTLNSILYGFGGVDVAVGAVPPGAVIVKQDHGVSLYCLPHLPAAWRGLTLRGVRFHGGAFDIQIRHTGSARPTVAVKQRV